MSDVDWQEEERITERTSPEPGQLVMPFYLLCDVSISMRPDMTALEEALADLRYEIVHDPVVADIVQFGVITFSDRARVVIPLGPLQDAELPRLQVEGGTAYGEAFRLLADTIEKDRQRLKSEGFKIYRPCVFFLTDGEPTDRGWEQTFQQTLTYHEGRGFRAYPCFVPYGFRDANESVLARLAYPPKVAKYYLAREANAGAALKGLAGAIGKTVITSGLSSTGTVGVQHILPPAPDGVIEGQSQYGEAGDFI